MARRHVACAAVWTFVVAHTGPLVGPDARAAGASIDVQKPCHAGLLRSQTIIASGNELDKSTITQKLELLAYLWPDVLVTGIELRQSFLENIDLVEREVA